MDSATRGLPRPADQLHPKRPAEGASRQTRLWQRIGPALPSTVPPFALILYLALRDGGYDIVVRSEVGVAIWLVLLVGALFGLIPLVRPNRAGLIALAALVGLTVWTALAMIWTESGEQTFEEVGRLLLFVGVFALALAFSDRWDPPRVLGAVAAALALVTLLALLSRLEPGWFPADEVAQAEPQITGRLSYPLGAFSALASLVAFGIPLVLMFAIRARTLAVQAIATAALPMMALTILYTFSRVGLIASVLGVAVYLWLERRRWEVLAAVVIGAIGSTLAVIAATQRDALEQGTGSVLAGQEGDEMLSVLIVTCAGTALIRLAIGLAVRSGFEPRLSFPRPNPRIALTALTVVGLAVAIAAGAPSELSDRWQEFKEPVNESVDPSGRFDSASGNGRYQYWEASVDAMASAPLTGIGAGAWELWWAREATIDGFSRFAHSLYLETAAELGVVGLILVLTLIGTVVATGIRRAARANAERRPLLAAAAAALVTFAFAAAVDWTWQMTVIPIAFLIVAAVVLGPVNRWPSATAERRARIARLSGVGVALVAVATLAVGLVGARLIESAQDATAANDPDTAIERAHAAYRLQPFSVTPVMEQAAGELGSGNLEAAASLAREATREEPTNWRPWYLLYKVEAELMASGSDAHRRAALDAYLRAQSLNPRSALVESPPEHLGLVTP
jgi:O-antigen ligase